jgi:hypothetical protein
MQLVLLALLALLSGARAHPGAIAEGRATCGSEYSTPQTAYRIPDIKESWFLRRVATCEAPVFWTTFDVETEGQKLYIATITPELPRFKDKHVFNAILYGPGVGPSLDGLSDVPATLPPGVSLASGIGDAAYMKSPADLTKCDFVDTNPVMEYYSDVIRERCMEKLTLDADYKDALQAGVTGFSWWIYSFNHKAGKPGRYYLQTWLSDASTGAVAQVCSSLCVGVCARVVCVCVCLYWSCGVCLPFLLCKRARRVCMCVCAHTHRVCVLALVLQRLFAIPVPVTFPLNPKP